MLNVGASDFVLATYNFILRVFGFVVSFLKSIPIGIKIAGVDVSLYHFMIAVLLMSIVVVGVVNVVKTAPINHSVNTLNRERSEARAEERYQRHRAENKRR